MKHEKMPVEGYVLGAIILFAIFGFLPLLKYLIGA
jgi:hypothetical protein